MTPEKQDARLREVCVYAALQLVKHKLYTWHFSFNERTTSLGLCKFTKQTIQLQRHFALHAALLDVKDTILHEIAHALVGGRHGHNLVWQAACVLVGANPVRTGNAVIFERDRSKDKYQAVCPNCRTIIGRQRPLKHQMCCCKCGPVKGLLTFTPCPAS